MVGRISGIIQHASNKKENTKRVRFTRFDSIDNQEVANALFSRVEKWAKEKGMDTVVGPLGFSDLEREGLLIEGFDQLSTFEEQYNYDYYQRLIETYGFEKEIDWTERKLYLPDEEDDRLKRISDKMLKRFNLRYGTAKNTRDFIKKYADKFFDIIDITYNHIYGSVPFTPGMRKMMLQNFNLIVDLKNVAVILDENDRVVCFGICFPSIAKSVQKCQGKLTPLGALRILWEIKHPKVIDLGLIGVLPEYAMKGVSSSIISTITKMLKYPNIDHIETNLTLETNISIINQFKSFKTVQHKRRRSFVKKID
jgi:hypothetical protein